MVKVNNPPTLPKPPACPLCGSEVDLLEDWANKPVDYSTDFKYMCPSCWACGGKFDNPEQAHANWCQAVVEYEREHGEYKPPMTAEEGEQWKETVREIFDSIIIGEALADEVLQIIEERHYDYFCKGRPFND